MTQSIEKQQEIICPCCDTPNARIELSKQQFAYAGKEGEVLLIADVPVLYCPSCQMSFVTADGEQAQHEAVCRHLGRLTPREIKEIRKSLNLSQNDLAARSKIGVASIKRWESGSHIQSAAMDKLLRSLSQKAQHRRTVTPRFRKQISEQALAYSKVFRLRPSTTGTGIAA